MRYRMMRFPENKIKAVTLSYDDGCQADVKLSQILTEHGIKCTFNINSGWVGADDWHLTKEQIQEHIIDKGHEIAVHGEFHKANGTMRPVEGIRDVLNCRLGLEKMFGFIVRGMAYPDKGITAFSNGTTMNDVSTYLTQLDIAYARTLGGSNDSFDLPADWHQWMPNCHHNNGNLFNLIDNFLNIKPPFSVDSRPKVFYLWGHAYEFNSDNNWDRIEKVCEKLGGQDDIWYATNIEIHDYYKAYLSLVFSADGSIVYNPTDKKIWFAVDNVPYEIAPGETIKIDE